MNYTKEEFLKALLEERKKTGKNPEMNAFYGCSIENITLTHENLNAGLFDDLILKDTPFSRAVIALLSFWEQKNKQRLVNDINHSGQYSDIIRDLYTFIYGE